MRSPARSTKSARLGCEALEDRVNPVAAFTLSGVGLGVANLIAFDTASPGVTTTTAITNLASNETLVGIDFRPQNGHLYALGVTNTSATNNTATLYDVSIRTGRATPVGGANGLVTTTDGLPNPTTSGTGYAFDFNPTVDLIRVIATDGDNFAINPNTGTTAANQTAVDTTLGLSGTAYTNNAPNLTLTTQYAIGASADALYRIPNPGAGAATLVGALNIGNFGTLNGFDIPVGVNVTTASGDPVTTGSAFANLTVGGVSRLYSVNLVTGAATLTGTIGNGGATNGLAVQNDYNGYAAVGTSGTTPGAANIVRFNTSTPGTTTTVAVTGLAATEVLVGSAFRPATGQLYGLGVNAAGTGTLYILNPQTGAATVVGATNGVTIPGGLPNPATANYGFAFNATVDAIRVITTANQSFAISVNGATAGTVVANAPAVTGATVDSATYTNAFGQAAGVGAPTTLYVLDSTADRLLIMNPGTSVATPVAPVTLNGAPLNFTAVTGFDVPAGVSSVAPNGTAAPAGSIAYATLVVGGTPGLYRINLTTGAATLVGTLGTTLTGLTLSDAPSGTINFGSATFSGNEGGSVAVTLTRTAATGPQTANVFISGGSSGGGDRAAGPFTVNFAEGVNTATVNIPLTADQLTEGPETFTLSISAPGAVVGNTASATVTINDTSTTPPPVFSAAQQIGNFLVLQGTGGTQVVQLPPGSVTIFADLTGDGQNDVILFLPTLVVVVNGQTGGFSLLSFDDNGDGFRDLLVFNANGTTTRTDGRTGIVTTQ